MCVQILSVQDRKGRRIKMDTNIIALQLTLESYKIDEFKTNGMATSEILERAQAFKEFIETN